MLNNEMSSGNKKLHDSAKMINGLRALPPDLCLAVCDLLAIWINAAQDNPFMPTPTPADVLTKGDALTLWYKRQPVFLQKLFMEIISAQPGIVH